MKRKRFEIRLVLNIDLEGSDHSAYILNLEEVPSLSEVVNEVRTEVKKPVKHKICDVK